MPIAAAVDSFAAVAGWQVHVESSDSLATTRTVAGAFTPEEALQRMVVGTGLTVRRLGPTSAAVLSQPVAVSGIRVVANAAPGYQVERSATLTKTDTPLRDVPQSVSVITHEVIADQQMAGLADVVRYVPGVTMGQGEGNRDQPTIRGNNGNGDLFVDGVRDDVEYLRDLYNTERVEVPKGSNALTFGRGAGGGLINRISKQAGWDGRRELTIQGGMYDQKRVSADLGAGFSDQVAARVNGVYENSGSYREQFRLKRYGVSPTLTWRPAEGTSLRGSYEFFKDDRTADRGIPSLAGAPLATEPSAFFGDPAESWSAATVHAAGATLEHTASASLRVRNHTRVARYRKMYQNVFPGAVNAAATQVQVTAYNNRIWRTNVFNQTDVTAIARTGGIEHTLLAGGELGRQSSDAYRNTGYFYNTVTSLSVGLSSPVTTGTPITFRQSATDADAHTTAVVASGYLQDQVVLAPQVQVLAGVRYDRFALSYHNNRNSVDLHRTDAVVSPRLGLVLKPAPSLSFYSSYGVSFLPSSGAQFTSLNVTTQTLEPEQFTNYEAGMKWDPSRAVSLTGAVYRLDRTNTSAPDPLDPTHTIQTGAQRSRGIELGLSGRITPAWQVLLGYGFQDVRITSRTNNAAVGQIPALAPRHTASMWNRYQATRVLGLGLGVTHQSRMFAAIDDLVTLPAFTRVDGAIFFDLGSTIDAQVNLENVFDVRYYPTAHNNNNITPGAPRTVRVQVTVTP